MKINPDEFAEAWTRMLCDAKPGNHFTFRGIDLGPIESLTLQQAWDKATAAFRPRPITEQAIHKSGTNMLAARMEESLAGLRAKLSMLRGGDPSCGHSGCDECDHAEITRLSEPPLTSIGDIRVLEHMFETMMVLENDALRSASEAIARSRAIKIHMNAPRLRKALDNALADNARLERELHALRQQLEKAK